VLNRVCEMAAVRGTQHNDLNLCTAGSRKFASGKRRIGSDDDDGMSCSLVLGISYAVT